MNAPVNGTPTSSTIVKQSDFERGIKVVIRCASCNGAMANAFVHPDEGRVSIGHLSMFDDGAIQDSPTGGMRFHCHRRGCAGRPFTMPAFSVAKLAEARATKPRDGTGRSINLGPPADR